MMVHSALTGSIPGMDGAGIAGLVQRLEAAEVGSRELDAQVWCIENGSTFKKMLPVPGFPGRHFSFRTSVGDIGFHGRDQAPVHHYTTSLDAALALAERVLPGMCVENLGEMRDSGRMTGHWLCQLGPRGPRRRLTEITVEALRAVADANPLVSAPTPALALCIAILRAVQSASTGTCGIAPLGDETQSSNNKGGETNG